MTDVSTDPRYPIKVGGMTLEAGIEDVKFKDERLSTGKREESEMFTKEPCAVLHITLPDLSKKELDKLAITAQSGLMAGSLAHGITSGQYNTTYRNDGAPASITCAYKLNGNSEPEAQLAALRDAGLTAAEWIGKKLQLPAAFPKVSATSVTESASALSR